jgi:hypothetical protein
MLEFIPLLFPIVLDVVIGIVTLILYQEIKRSGLAMIAVAFFLISVPDIVNLALGGPYMALRLRDQGLTAAEIGILNFYLFLVASAFHVVFAVLFLMGLFKLSRKS